MYYKVVNVDNESATSHENSVQYTTEKFVSSVPGHYLFVFDTLENARKFISNAKNHKIYECEVQGVVDIKTISQFLASCHLDSSKLPIGTVLVTSVKLIKEISQTPKIVNTYYFIPANSWGCTTITKVEEYDDGKMIDKTRKYNNYFVKLSDTTICANGINTYIINQFSNGFFLTDNQDIVQAIQTLIQNGYDVSSINKKVG